MQKIKDFIRQRIIDPISVRAVKSVAKGDPRLWEIWKQSWDDFEDFNEHFSVPVDQEETQLRIRLLVSAEVAFVKREIETILRAKKTCRYADVGDSDGSVRLLLKKYFPADALKTIGINLQPAAVEKMKKRGLDALCADALSVSQLGRHYDVVSVFETLEHLPDPIGFLSKIKDVVDERFVLSVPFVRQSRVSLNYLTPRWPKGKKPTVENTHIFELSPLDWKKIFLHTGWEVVEEKKLLMYPQWELSRLILQPFWRHMSFEGFWFVSLKKTDRYHGFYRIE